MRLLLNLLILVISGSALATIDVMQFKDETQGQQSRQLTERLHCPKCQNDSIADSNSMIATDLRQKVYELAREGKGQREIVDYMVTCYGNFVTCDPLLTPFVVLLWVMPMVTIDLDGWIIFARTRRRIRVELEEFPDDVIPDGKHGGSGLFVPDIVVALIVGAVSYRETGSYKQVQVWQQAIAQTPALLEYALDPKAGLLNEEDMARLALGLRMRLQAGPINVESWTMLGRIGMALGNASTATEAYASTYRLNPKNNDAALGYAEALIRSSDSDDSHRGGELLRRLVHGERVSVRILSMYTFNAFEQQYFGEAVVTWEMMLKLLPANGTRRVAMERSVKQAMEQLAPQGK